MCNFGDTKHVSENVYEMRIFSAPGYRIYYTERNEDIVFLLAGGDKSTQQEDIATAIELARNIIWMQ